MVEDLSVRWEGQDSVETRTTFTPEEIELVDKFLLQGACLLLKCGSAVGKAVLEVRKGIGQTTQGADEEEDR